MILGAMMQRVRLFFGIALALSIAVVEQAPTERLGVNVFQEQCGNVPRHSKGRAVDHFLAGYVRGTSVAE